MKHLVLLSFILTLLNSNVSAQIHIRQNDAKNHIGQNAEVLGHAYYINSVSRDYAILKVGYNKNSASLMVYYKFRYASSFANLTNMEFGHFIGTVILVKDEPVLLVDNLNHAIFHAPWDERVDSALYYLKRHEL